MANNPEYTSTIKEYIQSEPTVNINCDSFNIYDKIDGLSIISYNVLNDYKKELLDASFFADFTDNIDYQYYRYRPKLLSYDLYGTTELFFILLFINDIYDVKDFDRKTIRIIKKDKLSSILSYIYSSNKSSVENR